MESFVKRVLLKLVAPVLSFCLSRSVPATFFEWAALFRRPSFSQLGEDGILQSLVKLCPSIPKTYVDVGANHPAKFSNSYLFYLRGFRGVTIEPNPALVELHRFLRPEDIQICAAVSDEAREVDFLFANTDELSGIVAERADASQPEGRIVRMRTETLKEILDRVWPEPSEIGFLMVDCEGHDAAVLRSHDWERRRPWVVVAEDKSGETAGFMEAKGYFFVATCEISRIYALEGKVPKPV